MKKIIQKFIALLSCITITISISSRVYADTYDVEKQSKHSISACSSDNETIAIPNPNAIYNNFK